MENGEFRPYRIETLEPIISNFDTGDYVRQIKPITKFDENPYIGAPGQIGEI